jgi:hypothetical protein
MTASHRTHFALGTALLLAGCMATAPTRGQVGVAEVDSAVPDDARMVLGRNETFEAPMPNVANAVPVYPEGLLVQRLPPQTVCVRVSIDEDGGVSATAPISAGPDCPAPGNAETAFYQAASDAALTWHFEPAFLCVYPEGETPTQRGCYGEGVKEVPKAVSLVYRFVFEQVDGRGAVRMAQ